MKKELWIHIDSYRPNGNAPANRAFAFANYLSKKGFKINIVTIGKEDRIETREEATVYYLKDNYHFKKKSTLNRLLDNLTFSSKTSAFLKKHKDEIKDSFFMVSVPEYIAGSSCIKAKKYGAQLIVDIRDIWPEVAIEMGAFKQNSFKTKLFRHYANKYFDNADLILTVSERKVEHLRKIIKRNIDDRIYWIGNGFDLDTQHLQSDCSVLSSVSTTDRFVVSYVGNVGKAQHLISLVEYAKRVDTVSNDLFIISGTGAELNNLKKYVNDNELSNVVFTGKISKEQAKAVTCSSNVSFIPLATDDMLDSVPTKLFESLGLGVPVILVAKGESEDILNKSQFGICVHPSKSENLEDAFKQLKDNYSSILLQRKRAIDLMETVYSRQKYCEDLEQILLKNIS